MKKLLLFGFTMMSFLIVEAQTLCKRTSLYFDLNKSDLKTEAIAEIDKLLNSVVADSFLVELYGYSDSLASNKYNLKLSQNRIVSVEKYILSKKKFNYKFIEKNLGETENASTSKDLALNRRVDIFLFVVKNNMLVLGSPRESVELPLDYFEPCGICNSLPDIKAYYTSAQASNASIEFKTNTGEELITAGTFKFDFKPCNSSKKVIDTISLNVNSQDIDPEMTVWEPDTIKGIIYWKASDIKPVFDLINKRYVIRTNKKFVNLDKRGWRMPADYVSKIIFPKSFNTLKSSLINREKIRINETKNDTLIVPKIDTSYTIASIGKINETYYYLNDKLKNIGAKIDSNRVSYTVNTEYILPLSLYQEFRFSDTILRIKFKKSIKHEKIGFYLKDLNEFIPIDQEVSKNYITTKKPDEKYELAFIRKKKLYVIDNKNVVSKYNKKKNNFKIKFNSKTAKQFKQNKAYTFDNM
jgi:hypothetical protein